MYGQAEEDVMFHHLKCLLLLIAGMLMGELSVISHYIDIEVWLNELGWNLKTEN